MKTPSALLLLGVPCVLAALAACTQTKIVEQQVPAEGDKPGPGGNGDSQTPPDDGALADLAPDWHTKAASYLDDRASQWLSAPPDIANVKCAMSCHTTFPLLLARSALGASVSLPAADSARDRFETRVSEAAADKAIPFYGKDQDAKTQESHATESVLNAAALALDDLGKGSAISATSKTALDRMWSQQSTDGAWAWLEFGLEPWETRNDWGVAIAALVAGSIPEGTSSAQAAGVTKIKSYVAENLSGMVLHDKATVLWASGSLAGLLDAADATKIADALVATQREDGGFALRAWGQGDLADNAAKSDGYATSLAILALCKGTEGGISRPEVRSALTWLATHQKSDGSWPGASTNSTSTRARTFMTDAATSYATLALTQCGAVKPE